MNINVLILVYPPLKMLIFQNGYLILLYSDLSQITFVNVNIGNLDNK